MTIEIHELIIEARVTEDVSIDTRNLLHGEAAQLHEQQLVERITRQVMRQVLTQLREESWGIR